MKKIDIFRKIMGDTQDQEDTEGNTINWLSSGTREKKISTNILYLAFPDMDRGKVRSYKAMIKKEMIKERDAQLKVNSKPYCCPVCGGRQQITAREDGLIPVDGNGIWGTQYVPCPACGGTGIVWGE